MRFVRRSMDWPPPAPPVRQPAPPAPAPALAAMLADEADEAPFGGWAGEWLTAAPAEPPPPPPQPLVIEPPDWEAEARERAERDGPVEEQPPRPGALAELLGPYEPEYAVGPPLQLAPIERPVFPAPDWREEELERVRRDAGAIQDALEAPRERYPAKPKPRHWGFKP